MPNFVSADGKVFPRDYTYHAGEADSKVTSRSVAMEQVKRLLLEEIGTYIESHTEVKNFELTKDQITALTAGIVRLKIVDEKWDGEKYWLKAEIVVDPDDVTKKIDALRQDQVKMQELEDAKKRVEELLRENESLRKSASKNDQASVQLYQANIKSLEAAEMIREAQSLVSAGNMKKALELMNEAVSSEPKNNRPYGMRGFVLMKMGKKSEAINDFSKAMELKSDYAAAYCYRGHVYGSLREYEKSVADLNKCISLDLKPNQASVAYHARGLSYEFLKKYDEAIRDFTKAISLNPKYINAYGNRGLCYFRTNKFPEAVEDYNQVIALDPKQANAYYFRGNVFLEQKKYEAALQDYDQAISLNPEYRDAYGSRGIVYVRMKKYAEAMSDYNKAILLDPDSARTYFNRALLCEKMGKKGQAMADLKKAAKLGNENAKNYLKKKEGGANVTD